MNQVLLAGAGGFLGASLRHALMLLGGRFVSEAHHPWFTLGINTVGCLGLGMLLAWLQSRAPETATTWRVFLGAGVLGGFTTYSTFAVATVELWSSPARSTALLYVALHLVFGIGAAVLGLVWGRALA